jgi:hypothetical protein
METIKEATQETRKVPNRKPMLGAFFMQGRHLNAMVVIVRYLQGGFRDSLKGAAMLHFAQAEYERLGLTQHYSVQGMLELARIDHDLSG